MPQLTNISLLDLGGIQPVTKAMAEAAGGTLHDNPSPGEVELFRAKGTSFQMISLVASVVVERIEEDHVLARPFALTLIPASKRGEISEKSIEFIEKIDVDKWRESRWIYSGYNPFTGYWSLYSNLGTMPGKGFVDELGLVIDQFFLATEYEEDDVIMLDLKMPNQKLARKYEKHRARLLFRPFHRIEARRIWGADSPIELFVLQELARRGLHPQIQISIMEDGSTFPSLYHFWHTLEDTDAPELVSEVDLFFPDQRVAVFCDGGHHNRKPQRERDAKINAQLESIGITPLRFPGKEIITNLPRVADEIERVISSRP